MATAAKVALITGAGSGIGRMVCSALSSSGFNCVVADVNLAAAAATQETLPSGKR